MLISEELKGSILDRSSVHFTEILEDEEQAFCIHQFLHDMKDPYKEVFSLRVFGELSFEKIAMLFGKSPGWVRVTYHRARKQIIAYMMEPFVIESGKVVSLEKLEDNTPYIVEYRADGDYYAFTFV